MNFSDAVKKTSKKVSVNTSIKPLKRRRPGSSISEATYDKESTSKENESENHLEKQEKSSTAPVFQAVKKMKMDNFEERKVNIPQNRLTPLKTDWVKIVQPITENLFLNIRFNTRTRQVELRTTDKTPNCSNIQKAADFIHAFVCGFDVDDAMALIRLHDLYVETFDVKDVKMSLQGDHIGRAVGRLAGKGGKTRYILENATKTRIIIADTIVHIMGSYSDITQARRAVCSLIMGSPPSKVFGSLRAYSAHRYGSV